MTGRSNRVMFGFLTKWSSSGGAAAVEQQQLTVLMETEPTEVVGVSLHGWNVTLG